MRLLLSLCLFGAHAFAQKQAAPLNPVSLALPDLKLSAEDALRRARESCHGEVARQNPSYRGPEACFCLDHPDSVRCKKFARPGPFSIVNLPAYPDDVRNRAFGPAITRQTVPVLAPPLADGPRLEPAELLRFAHPQAALVLGVRPAALLNSPVLAPLLAGFVTKETEAMVNDLRRVEAVYFSLAPLTGPGQTPDFVALLAGDFSQGMPDFGKSVGGPLAAYWVDRHTVVLGPDASARAAHRRILAKGPATSALARQSTARVDADLWVAADLGRILDATTAGSKTPFAALGEVRTVAFGLSAREEWTLHADLGALNAPGAAKLLNHLREELRKSAGPGEDWIQDLEMKAEGAHVIVTARLAGDKLRAAVNSLGQMGGLPTKGAAAPRRPPPAPKKAVVWGQ